MKSTPKKSTQGSKTNIKYDPRPSAYTLFRHQIYDQLARQVILEMHQRLKHRVWQRDRSAVQRISRVQSLDELLDLAGLAVGLGQDAWDARLQDFEADQVLIGITSRLKSAGTRIKNRGERSQVYECLMRALRWREEVGAQVLLECFNQLDTNGKGLACVVLGLVKEARAADVLWDFYLDEHAGRQGQATIGALWGLVDLGDGRANQALLDRLNNGKWNYELFGWLCMRGDLDSVVPLLQAIVLSPDKVRIQPMMALVGVAQRAGRAAVTAAVQDAFHEEAQEEEVLPMIEQIYSQPAAVAEQHFETFYRGLTLNSVKTVMDQL